MEGNERNQIEQENPYLVNRHAGVMKQVKLLNRNMKPSAMKQIHPVMRQHEEQKPHHKDSIVEQRTP